VNSRPIAALVVAAALAAVPGCGGGGGKKSTTTSVPTSLDTPTSEQTTSSTIDPALQSLLLVAADLPGFKEPTSAAQAARRSTSCESTTAPAVTALFAAPSVEGTTFEKGTGGAVKVSSSAIGTTAEQAGAGLTELVDPKVQSCLSADLKASAEKDLPTGSTLTLKLTSAKATVTGVDQTVLLSGTGTLKTDTTASTSDPSSTSKSSTTSKTAKTVVYDQVFLRSGGTILVLTYSGPSDQATSVERQRIVATAAKKLASASGSGTSSTTTGGSSTSTSVGGSTTSHKSTSTTRRTTTTKKTTTTPSTT